MIDSQIHTDSFSSLRGSKGLFESADNNPPAFPPIGIVETLAYFSRRYGIDRPQISQIHTDSSLRGSKGLFESADNSPGGAR